MKENKRGNSVSETPNNEKQSAAINTKGASSNPEGITKGSISSVTQRDKDDSNKKSFKENREKNTMSVSEWRKGEKKDHGKEEGESDENNSSSLSNKKSVESENEEDKLNDEN